MSGADILKAAEVLGPVLLPHVRDWLDGKDVPKPLELADLPDLTRLELSVAAAERRAARARGQSKP